MACPRRGCRTIDKWVDAVKLSYNAVKGPECFLSILTSAVLAEECNVVVNNEELIGAIEYLLQ